MAPRRSTANQQRLHVVPADDYELDQRPHLRSVDSLHERGAEVIHIDSGRRPPRQHLTDRQVKEPAMLAKWAVGLSVVMFLAALTSGQA